MAAKSFFLSDNSLDRPRWRLPEPLDVRRGYRSFKVGLGKSEMTGHIIVVKPNVREQLLDTGLQVLHRGEDSSHSLA